MSGLLIEATGIKRAFPVGGGLFWALKGLDLSVAEKKLTIFKGRSGSGSLPPPPSFCTYYK